MSQETEETTKSQGGESFAELFAKDERRIEEGRVVQGTVLSIEGDHVLVDIGFKSEGLVPLWEFMDDDGHVLVKPGDKVDVLVEQAEDDQGYVVLAKEKADRLKVWEEISRAYEADEPVEGTVVARVKGGLSVNIGVKAFLPGSQVDLRPVRNLESVIGQRMQFKIIKFNKRRGNIVLSRRALLEKERRRLREQTLQTLEVGQIVDGVVKNLTEYGAFVDLGGIDGLLHVTDMSWGRVRDPSKVVNVGDTVEAVVLEIDEANRRISLGMKQIEPNPWTVIEEKYPVGTRVRGVVRNITNFGLFVGLEEGIDGLVHVSDISWTEPIKHPGEKFKKGDEVEAVVLKIDKENEKFSLGIKQLQPNPWDDIQKRYPVGSKITGEVSSVTQFGAFVKLPEGLEGLIYSSELYPQPRGGDPSEVVKPGDTVEAIVLKVDPVEQKISLSMKAVHDKEQREALREMAAQASSQTTTLGDLIAEKLAQREGSSESEEGGEGS